MAKTAEQTERAHELMTFLIEHPEMHDQNFWIQFSPQWNGEVMTAALVFQQCGTTACAAGWTVLLAGGKVCDGYWAELDDKRVRVPALARGLLGLTVGEAHHLFHETYTLDEVCDVLVSIFGPLRVGVS